MRPNTSREDILEAAIAVAARDGSGRLTIDAVAREVGMSKAGVLYNFPSKEVLLAELLAHMMQCFEGCTDEQRAKAPDVPNAHLTSTLSAFHDFLQSDPHLPQAILTAGVQNPELLEPLRKTMAKTIAIACDETRDPIGALIVMAAMDGMLFQHMLGLPPRDPKTRDAMFARLHQMTAMLEPRTCACD